MSGPLRPFSTWVLVVAFSAASPAARGLKTAEDRQAFAIDPMGLAYADWRRLRNEPWWGSALKAAARVDDLSAFRFVTNLVRLKRLREE